MPKDVIVAYCVKCREKQPIASAQAVFLGAQKRPATQGVCPICGTKIVRFGPTPAHKGLEPAASSVQRQADSERRSSGRKMVIVESPAKARTVGRLLGQGYAVEASVGHVRDLPANRMGVDLDHDFAPRYVIPSKKKEVVKRLRAKAQQAAEVFLATDPDREGEAIAWHLEAALQRQLQGIPVHRVEFHEITQQAIRHAFAHPRQINRERVDAQQARRILDRVVGYVLSPLLRDKMGRRGLSAGRVQSVALRLICEREREIQAFVPVEYWSIEAELSQQPGTSGQDPDNHKADPPSFIARLFRIRGQEPDLKKEADARAILEDLRGVVYVVGKVTRREVRRSPPPPFMTSSLQQEASRKLGFTAKRTMAVAQALYEGKDIGGGEVVGLITYMRTDSLAIAEPAQAEARQLILERFGQRYVPPKPPVYKTKAKSAQEAHEAIRPTSIRREPAALKEVLTRDELRLYTLIWKRFLASQMAAAILDQTIVDILAGPEGQEKPYLFRATGSVVTFAGFLTVYQEGREEEEQGEEGEGVRLPELQQGEHLRLIRLIPKQHFTQPPPRFSEASLIRVLEEYGIGRPSTYAPILATIQQRAYVERVAKKLVPTVLGFTVNDLLVEFFPDIVNVSFTAEMEEKLDLIATGDQEWIPMLHDFYRPFAASVQAARETMPEIQVQPTPTGEPCPECGKPLLFRMGRFGKFIGCSGWPDCRYTAAIPLPGVSCPQCGSPVVEKRTRRGRRFYGCTTYPACEWASWKEPKTPQGERPLQVAAPVDPR
jgi:DNA topoisomerase I